jgi:hypothetical protein
MKSAYLLLTICIFAASVPAEEIKLLPAQFTLSGPEARQALLIEQSRDNIFVGQIKESMTLTSGDPEVLRIKNGVAIPVANGKVTITATANNQTSKAEVTVTAMDKSFAWSFRNHVQPVLMKAGCSTGACHGAAAGQNGFKLSLRGYDDVGDWRTITRGALERRVVLSDPSQSLLLLKPTQAVPHKGGERFKPDSLEYRILAEWIAAGTPPPSESDPRIERIEIIPDRVVLKPGMEQQIVVLAHFSDGSTSDVTRWCKFNSTEMTVTSVSDTGLLKIAGQGEGAITAWYLSKIGIATVTVPFKNDLPPDLFARTNHRNFIDKLVLEKLAALNIAPSPLASDSEFIRRAFLDTIGVLPTLEETKKFLADPSPDKRDRLIESLLNRPEFVDYWSYKWSDLLLVSSRKLNPRAMWGYYNWVRDQVAANTPWDQFARQLVTAKGSTLENGAANFYMLHDDPKDMSETMSLAMLGMSVGCAKCHNHPLEKWTNNQYYGMANLFARVRTKNAGGDGNFIVFAASEGDLVQPLTGKPQPPRPLDAKPLEMNDPADRREYFADWLVSKDNPYFSRAITNRVWANFMGVGLVEKVDDMRLTNPASNEKLLGALANNLVENKYDLKSLMRLILQSDTYQRSSKPTPQNQGDTRFYSRYYPRRIMAEVLLDAFSQVAAAPTNFKDFPEGWRATQLPDSNIDSYFLKAFGRPERSITCECERTIDPSMAQVLHIANGDTINKKLEQKGNRIEKAIAAKASDEAIVEEAYLTALSRKPTEEEKSKIIAVLSQTKPQEKRAAIEDVYWSILSRNEFLFNH